ncbi:MAG TPA: NeuD/PglB/VioB family sugar acetyltransferase [Candidatus Polarisedimenticolaceae bacterium]|nr:NeuD/PglB/VioB family sugar acetyltransferase [Candidatus Polarisedimenticolaceae bacterium]
MKRFPSTVHVIGAGGHAKVVVATIRAAGGEVGRILDDDPALHGRRLLGAAIGGPVTMDLLRGAPAVIAVGDNATRRELARRLDAEWIAVCHPSAVVHASVTIGPGTVVFAGVVIQPDTTIGAHAIVNTGATIDHDCRLGDFVHVGPGVSLCGGVAVGDGALLGVGARVCPSLRIGAGAVVGAGAACVADVADGARVVGVPAR